MSSVQVYVGGSLSGSSDATSSTRTKRRRSHLSFTTGVVSHNKARKVSITGSSGSSLSDLIAFHASKERERNAVTKNE